MHQKTFYSVAALAICGAIFANDSKKEKPTNTPLYQGDILTDNRYPPAYNAPAKIDLLNRKNCNQPYNVFFDASLIYWYASQDGLELARSGDLGVTQNPQLVVFNHEGVELIQPFRYDPGFKVGLGFGFKEWEIHAEYTWIRQHTFVSSNAPTNQTNGAAYLPVWAVNPWFAQGIGNFAEYVSATHVSSSWHLGIDMLDVTAGRPYYQSPIATISPYGGLRAAWIRQSLHLQATVPAAAGNRPLIPQPTHSHNHSNCWGVGPAFGIDGHCLVGAGFRVEGDGGIGILFTQYTTFSHKEDSPETGTLTSVVSFLTKNYNCLRPMANLGLGVGWGKYLDCKKYHLDFSVDYDFNVFWDQNMIRVAVEDTTLQPTTYDDLFLHGLTVTGRFDF